MTTKEMIEKINTLEKQSPANIDKIVADIEKKIELQGKQLKDLKRLFDSLDRSK